MLKLTMSDVKEKKNTLQKCYSQLLKEYAETRLSKLNILI